MFRPISPRFRVALLGKGLLLLSLGMVFGALLHKGVLGVEQPLWVKAVSAVLFGAPTAFLGWTAALAFVDAVLGQAVEVSGAVALRGRRFSGVSFRLPDGRSAEFLLFNPGPKLVPDARYRVTVGRYSRVLVAPAIAVSPEPAQ